MRLGALNKRFFYRKDTGGAEFSPVVIPAQVGIHCDGGEFKIITAETQRAQRKRVINAEPRRTQSF